MERTVGHLVMAGRPGFGNRRQFGVGVDVAGTRAVLQLAEVVGHALNGLWMPFGLEQIGVATATSRPVRGELPRGLVRVGGVAGSATRRPFVLARVFGRRVRERNRRPVRVVMTRRAVERGRHVIGDFAGCRATVVAALTVGHETRVIEAGRAPRQCPVTRAAILCGWDVIARHTRCADTRMTRTAGAPCAVDSGPDHHVDARVLQANRCKGVRRMARIAVVVARDVARVLAHCLHAIVTTEAGTAYLQVIHAHNRQEVVLGVARLAVVLRQDVSHRTGSRVHPRSRCMTANAGSGSALEDTLQMAVFAREIPVEAAQLIACGQMVELGALDCRRMRK